MYLFSGSSNRLIKNPCRIRIIRTVIKPAEIFLVKVTTPKTTMDMITKATRRKVISKATKAKMVKATKAQKAKGPKDMINLEKVMGRTEVKEKIKEKEVWMISHMRRS